MIKTAWVNVYKSDSPFTSGLGIGLGASIFNSKNEAIKAYHNTVGTLTNLIDIIQISWNEPDQPTEYYSIVDRRAVTFSQRTPYGGFKTKEEAVKFLSELSSTYARENYFIAKTVHTPV